MTTDIQQPDEMVCRICGYHALRSHRVCLKCRTGLPLNADGTTKPGRFNVGDRVRVKRGSDRGHYGTVTSRSGDFDDYYGIKLDCHEKPVGYCEYELDDETKVTD